MYEEIKIYPTEFYDFLKSNIEIAILRDNPKYTARRRGVNNNILAKLNSLLVSLRKEYVNDIKATDRLTNLEERLNAELRINFIVNGFNCKVYADNVTNLLWFRDSVLEKIGCITYGKEFMCWYDLGTNLVDLLSLLSGTDPYYIYLFLNEYIKKYRNDGYSVEQFSEDYLCGQACSLGRIPIKGCTQVLFECMPPAVLNVLDMLIAQAKNTDYIIRASNSIIANRYNDSDYFFVNDDSGNLLSENDMIDLYISYVLRVFNYYLLSQIYNKITTDYRPEWAEENNVNLNVSEMLIAWTIRDIVFQNDKNKEFPTFIFKGRGDSSMEIKPNNYKTEDAIVEYVKGNLII